MYDIVAFSRYQAQEIMSRNGKQADEKQTLINPENSGSEPEQTGSVGEDCGKYSVAGGTERKQTEEGEMEIQHSGPHLTQAEVEASMKKVRRYIDPQ